MIAAIPTFHEVSARAMRERKAIVAVVLMGNDAVKRIAFGPRGGWKELK